MFYDTSDTCSCKSKKCFYENSICKPVHCFRFWKSEKVSVFLCQNIWRDWWMLLIPQLSRNDKMMMRRHQPTENNNIQINNNFWCLCSAGRFVSFCYDQYASQKCVKYVAYMQLLKIIEIFWNLSKMLKKRLLTNQQGACRVFKDTSNVNFFRSLAPQVNSLAPHLFSHFYLDAKEFTWRSKEL